MLESWWIVLCLVAVVLWTTGNLIKPLAALVPVGPVLLRAEVGFAALQGMWLIAGWATLDHLQLLLALALASAAEAVVQITIRGRVRAERRKEGPGTGGRPPEMEELLRALNPFR